MSDFNRPVIDEFRANRGQVGGPFEGAPLLLLTTTGARSGRPHTTPAVYAADAGRLIVFATNAGSPAAPAWLHNLRAHPAVTIELGNARCEAVATEITGPDRDRLYADQARRNPAFQAYQDGTTRTIQVVALEPTRLNAAATQLREIHNGLRRQLAELRAAVDTGETQPAVALDDLQRNCLTFCSALHAHHDHENGVFPTLAADFPHLKPTIDQLRADHEAVATLNTALIATAENLGTTPTETLRAQLLTLTEALESHYLREEIELDYTP
ncbi:nitroreductase/quinone reductase family protein [Kribbella sp. DT2]|uniref:nitroreductase/quinone reductase family protein n=1 Tax=Kribbella sp. DT2 TaxID=3393427 RepID=UPI003CFB8257